MRTSLHDVTGRIEDLELGLRTVYEALGHDVRELKIADGRVHVVIAGQARDIEISTPIPKEALRALMTFKEITYALKKVAQGEKP